MQVWVPTRWPGDGASDLFISVLGALLPSALPAKSWRQAGLIAKLSYLSNSSGIFKVGGSQKPCRQIPPR